MLDKQINAERDRYNTRGRDLYAAMGGMPPHPHDVHDMHDAHDVQGDADCGCGCEHHENQ
jgi:hypothetical protein